MIDKIEIASIPIHLFTVSTLHKTIKLAVISNKKTLFLHANARLIELANSKEKWLQDLFNMENSYVICDGAGVQVAARLTDQRVPEKIPYNTWIWSFAEFMSKENLTVFLLGADQDTISTSRRRLEEQAPGLRIVGIRSGYFNKDRNSADNQKVLEYINAHNPDILLVGFGMPIQEKWVKENYDFINAKCIFPCGGAFDFISGNKPVAPKIFQKLYLEWLFRFVLEPVRLSGRVTTSFLRFGRVLLKLYLK